MTAERAPASPRLDAPEDAESERLLWMRVIYQAIEDAADQREGYAHAGGDRAQIAEAARAWLSVDCRDFRYVCQLAGLDPADVQAAAARTLDSGATPQQLRKQLSRRVEGKRGAGGLRSRIGAAA
jgi:hypothetical protein